ncbi:MAG: hypothetical protein MJZ58_02345 [Paludibacteraceae bacterium]|nr:hypothetical protein [Paludibacteraceae bacterium]
MIRMFHFNRILCIVHCALALWACIFVCASVQAETTIIPHPFTVGIDGEGQSCIIYFAAENIGKDTWKESYEDDWRLLTKDEWNYLLNTRSITGKEASSFRGWAQLIDGDNVTNAYAVLLPDDWASRYHFEANAWYKDGTKAEKLFTIGSTFDSNKLTETDMTALQQAGAVFLPCDITAPEGVYAEGQYWTSTKVENSGISYVQFSSSATTPEDEKIQINDNGEESYRCYVLLAKQEVTITLNENVNNTELLEPWATHHKPVNVNLVRSLTPGMYNTLCLPFDLTAGEVKTAFGDATKLAKFTGGTLSEDKKTLNINFEEIDLSTDGTAIEAGVAYLIEPSQQVTDPTFANRVIEQTAAAGESFSPSDAVAYLGIINPHQLAAGDKRYLFLQANNTLTWSKEGDESTMKGMRGYFYVPQMADGETIPKGCPARLSVRPAPQTPTGLGQGNKEQGQRTIKFMRNGKLFIEYNGVIYNMQGGHEL